MSDARAPAMDVHMTPQDAGMARSFWLILSALLMWDNGYANRCSQQSCIRFFIGRNARRQGKTKTSSPRGGAALRLEKFDF